MKKELRSIEEKVNLLIVTNFQQNSQDQLGNWLAEGQNMSCQVFC